jgi:hypothetical protein
MPEAVLKFRLHFTALLKLSLKKRIKISIIWLVVVISGTHVYMGTHLYMHSALRGLKIGSPRQPPTDIATQYRMPEEPPGGAGWLHRKHSNGCSETVHLIYD